MTKEDLISIIMSVYNGEIEWIEKSVESILMQTYSNFELVIILDNPKNILLKNRLEKYVAEDERIKLIINPENKGLVKSLNIALENCRGKYIARMDEDDISIADRLEKQKKYLEENDLDFVFSGVTIIDEKSNEVFKTNQKKLDWDQCKSLLEITNISNHPTWFLKAEIYRCLGGYREVNYTEDYDFTLRCLARGYRIGKMDYNVLKYRVRSSSISRQNELEQYLNSEGVLNLYRKKVIEDYDLVEGMMIHSKEKSTDKEKLKFACAGNRMNEAIESLKTKRIIKSGIKCLYGLRFSRYYRKKLLSIMKYKLISRKY